MAKGIDQLRHTWEALGTEAYLPAIFVPDRERPWDEQAFFHSGKERIARVLEIIDGAGLTVIPNRALDFGCGVGRLTFPLAEHFNRVEAVDISAPMLDHARRYLNVLEVPPPGEVRFHLNTVAGLSRFPDPDFSLVISYITLQHMKPTLARRYILELSRLTGPKGILVLQVPDRRRTAVLRVRGRIGRTVHRWRSSLSPGGRATMEMYGLDRDEMAGLIQSSGLELVRCIAEDEPVPTWSSFTYLAVRR